ncbi:chitooligosaccharide deacetylase [Bacillus anthracis]|nr:chitooligosaccharide deacetylase [Bacillus anthracis]PGX24256.1 chitooligosaccharide deacetylase [Bacillus anthracis]
MISLCSKPISIYAFTDSSMANEKTGKVIWEVNTREKIVALTFDDGPHPVFTPQILDILAKYNAKATFFVAVNKVKRFPAIIIREVKERHEIANLTYNHIYNENITAAKLTSELNQTDEVIKKITGYKPTLYRPVGGLHNELIINTAIQNGKLVILWSWYQDPQVWRSPAASKISKHIIKGVQPGNIILLHDWNGSEFSETCQTVEALESILIHLKNNGYTCVTVSEMLYRSIKIIPSLFDPIYQ